jgi:hypothetical protein
MIGDNAADLNNRFYPVPVYTGGYINGKIIEDVFVGVLNTCVLDTDRIAYCFGKIIFYILY